MTKREKTSHPNIFQYANGSFYYRGTIKGRRVEEPLNTTKWRTALENARKLEASENIADQVGCDLRVEDVYPTFMKEKESKIVEDGQPRSKKSIRRGQFNNYKSLFENHLLPFYRYKQLHELNQDDVLFEEFKQNQWRKDKPLPKNLHNLKSCWTNFKRWCVKKDYITKLHSDLDIPITSKRKPIPFVMDEFNILLDLAANSSRRRGLFLYCVLYGGSALRNGEIISLSWPQINFEKRGLVSKEYDTLTKTQRVIPFNDMVFEALVAHRSWQQSKGIKSRFVFPNAKDPKRHMHPHGFTGAWRRLLEDCRTFCTKKEIKGLFEGHRTPHDLRRMWAVYANLNPNITDMQRVKFAGHSKDVQRENYVDFVLDQLRPASDVIQLPSGKVTEMISRLGAKSNKTKRKRKKSGGKLGETGAKRD